jgi:hypothetical protein
MFIDLHARSTSQALTGRAASPDVRNPLLSLPSAARAADMPVAAREWLLLFLQDVRRDAQERAAKSLRTHKAPMYLYWKIVAVYAGHLAKVLRHAAAKASTP